MYSEQVKVQKKNTAQKMRVKKDGVDEEIEEEEEDDGIAFQRTDIRNTDEVCFLIPYVVSRPLMSLPELARQSLVN